MKIAVILAALVVAVSAMPQKKDEELTSAQLMAQRIDARFRQYLGSEKRALEYPDGFWNKVCDGTDCCSTETCDRGTCKDISMAGSDDVISRYGYICTGSMCGTKPGQYAGTFCDVLSDTACDQCESKHGKKPDICYASSTFKSGYICMAKLKDGDYQVFDRRQIDVSFGEGSAKELERIARDEAEAKVDNKATLKNLIRDLIKELE